MLALDKFGHLLTKERGVVLGRLVASSLDAGIFLFKGPRGRGSVDRNSFISPLTEECSSRVINVIKFGGKVGKGP